MRATQLLILVLLLGASLFAWVLEAIYVVGPLLLCVFVMVWFAHALWKKEGLAPPASHLRKLFFLCIFVVFVRSMVNEITPTLPNQIYFGFFVFIGGMVLFYIFTNKLKYTHVFVSGIIIYIYLLYLLSTSAWAYYPEATLDQFRFDWIFAIIFWIFYCLSLNLRYEHLITFFLVFPAIVFTWAFTYNILGEIEFVRLSGTYNVAIAVPFIMASLACDKTNMLKWVCLLMTIILLAISKQKTAIGAGCLGLILSAFFIYPRLRSLKEVLITAVAVTLMVAVVAIAMFIEPRGKDFLFATIGRFGYDMEINNELIIGEAPDRVRSQIEELSIDLLKDNWVAGIGYMNFMSFYGARYNNEAAGWTAIGKHLVGMNLHNSFMTWWLEGGLPCVIIVVIILGRYFSILRNKLTTSRTKSELMFSKAAMVCMIQLLFIGLFQQVHAMVELWLMIGLVYAIAHRRDNIESNPRPFLAY